MKLMPTRARAALALLAWLLSATAFASQDRSTGEALPGNPAPEHVFAEIWRAVDGATARFTAMDAGLRLAAIRTGTLTKAGIAEQLRAVFVIHDQVSARVRIDDVRMVCELAWVYSTGEVTGRLRWVGRSVPVLSGQRELEVARRENGNWCLYGYRQ